MATLGCTDLQTSIAMGLIKIFIIVMKQNESFICTLKFNYE